jgi:hypothetical protein
MPASDPAALPTWQTPTSLAGLPCRRGLTGDPAGAERPGIANSGLPRRGRPGQTFDRFTSQFIRTPVLAGGPGCAWPNRGPERQARIWWQAVAGVTCGLAVPAVIRAAAVSREGAGDLPGVAGGDQPRGPGLPVLITAAGIVRLFAGLWFALRPAAAPGCRDESPESGLASLLEGSGPGWQ